jgi:hypothetical protein
MTIVKNLNEDVPLTDNDLREMVQKNLQLSEEMHAMMKKMDHFIFWSRFTSFLKIFLIIVPLALSFIYLSPLLKNTLSQYQELLDMGQTVGGAATGVDLKTLSPELQKLIPKK